MLGQSDSTNANAEMTAVLASTPETAEEAKYEAPKTHRLGVGGYLAAGWLIFAVAVSILVPLFAKTHPSGALATKGFLSELSHPMGGDSNGNNLTVVLAEAMRNSFIVALGAVIFGLIFGGTFGLVGGYFRGKLDAVLSALFNILLAIPQFILAVSLVAVLANNRVAKDGTALPVSFERRMVWLIVALGIVGIPILGRITRANTLQWSQRDFVMAARAQGASNFRILTREILPNVMPAMFSIALLGVAVAIVAEGGLAILGSGVQGGWSLGNVIATGREGMRNNPHTVFEPVVLIFLTVLSLNYLGDIVRARFDVRESVL
jgi:peptide/nickel transport system permease protein